MSSSEKNFEKHMGDLMENIMNVFDYKEEKYDDEQTKKNPFAPTEYLYKNVAKLGLTEIKKGPMETTYDIGQIEGDFHIYVTLSNTAFQVQIIDITVKEEQRDAKKMNNFGFSPNSAKNMYIYGVKANGEGPKIPGKELNNIAFDICQLMHIPELFISDSAGVQCHYDKRIDLDHFSILRVMAGKKSGEKGYVEGPGDTFYESLRGHFLNPDAVAKEKQTIYDAISAEERKLIREYLDSLDKPEDSSKSDICNQFNDIIKKVNPKEIFSYISIPYGPQEKAKNDAERKEEADKKAKEETAVEEEAKQAAAAVNPDPLDEAAKKAKEEADVKAKEEADKLAAAASNPAATTASATTASIIVQIGPSNSIEILNTLPTGANLESGSFDNVIKNTGTNMAYVAIQISKQTCIKANYCITFNGENYEMELDNLMNNVGTALDDAFLSFAPSPPSSSSANISTAPSSSSANISTTPPSTPPSSHPNNPENTYMETQKEQLCGKHALNHLLQEEKIVWLPQKNTLVTQGGENAPENSSTKDKNIKYNLWNFCQVREKNEIDRLLEDYITGEANRRANLLGTLEPNKDDPNYIQRGTSNLQNDINEWKKIQTKYKGMDPDKIEQDVRAEVQNDENLKKTYIEQIKTSQGTCETNGNVPFQWFADIFEELGYRYTEVGKNDYQAELEKNLNEPNYLGFFINQGAWHYVSSPKYSNYENNCEYVIADSMGPKYTCYKSKDEYYEALKFERGYLIFADDNAYQSVAVERMNKLGKSAAEVKPENVAEVKDAEVKPENVAVIESENVADVKDADVKDADVKDADVKDADVKDAEVKPENVADVKDAEVKPENVAEVKDAEVKDAEVKDAEVKDADVKDADVKDAEVKDAEVKDAELDSKNVADTKPEDAKPEDAKPEDTKSEDTKSEDVKVVDAKPNIDAVIKKFMKPPPGPPPGPRPKNIQEGKDIFDKFNAKPKEIDPTTVFKAKTRTPAQEKMDAMRAEFERTRRKGGSLKKNKKTKRKYYVYNK